MDIERIKEILENLRPDEDWNSAGEKLMRLALAEDALGTVAETDLDGQYIIYTDIFEEEA